VTEDDVPQLRHFVESGAAEEASDKRYAWIALRGPHGTTIRFRVHVHRAELVHLEKLTAVIVNPSVEAAGETPPPVDADADLRVQNRTAPRQCDRQSRQQNERREQNERQDRDADVERPGDHLVPFAWS